jgi:hypothetical protein
MNPPGNLEGLRAFLVSTLQTFPDFVTAQVGYVSLTTFVNNDPTQGVAVVGGIPQSSIFGRVKGTVQSAIENSVARVGIAVIVNLAGFNEDLDQIAQPIFSRVHFTVTVAESPEVNQSPQGTGLSALYMCERIQAALKMLNVPQASNGVASSYIMPMEPFCRDAASDKDSDSGYSVYVNHFEARATTIARSAP